MLIKKITFCDAEEFLHSNFSSPTHWPDWNIVVSKHFVTTFYYLGYFVKDSLVGICPIHEVKKGLTKYLFSGHIHFVPNGGWIFSSPVEFEIDKINIPVLKSLHICSLPLLREFNVSYLPLDEFNKKETLIVDLTKPIDFLWQNDINSKRRNMIRKAEKSNVIIKQLSSLDLEIFHKYYKECNIKNNISYLSLDFLKDLYSNCTNIQFSIWAAIYEEELIGSIASVNDKDYSIYWLGITRDKINIGQGELLQWEVIRKMKDRGCKYYDLCFIDRTKLDNIFRFKSGFSSTFINVYSGTKKSYLNRFLSKASKFL